MPNNPCFVCWTPQTSIAWTYLGDGATCVDGYCSGLTWYKPQTCMVVQFAGPMCAGGGGTQNCNGSNQCKNYACNGSSGCSSSNKADGTSCLGGTCFAGICQPSGGQCNGTNCLSQYGCKCVSDFCVGQHPACEAFERIRIDHERIQIWWTDPMPWINPVDLRPYTDPTEGTRSRQPVRLSDSKAQYLIAGSTFPDHPAAIPEDGSDPTTRSYIYEQYGDILDGLTGPEWSFEVEFESDGLAKVHLGTVYPDMKILVLDGPLDPHVRAATIGSYTGNTLTWVAQAERTYTIVVDGYQGAMGDFEVRVDFIHDIPWLPDRTMACEDRIHVERPSLIRFELAQTEFFSIVSNHTTAGEYGVAAYPAQEEIPDGWQALLSDNGVIDVDGRAGDIWYIAVRADTDLTIVCGLSSEEELP